MPGKLPNPDGRPLLVFLTCPNSECADFNHLGAGNLSVAEWMGKDKAIRRLYCKTCGHRLSERRGSLMQDTKLDPADGVRIIKYLGHGCLVEATADICEVDPRTVRRLLEKAGQRTADFHRLQLDAASLLPVGRNPGDGLGVDRRGLGYFEVYPASGSSQRPIASGLGRTA